ncbi:hypothetical protein GQ457_03G013330 [Hibiscus cannabinus]
MLQLELSGRKMDNVSGRWKHKSTVCFARNRRGFTVFINNVSKRIHRRTLWEEFQEYGYVSDVFIAYNNIKRRSRKITFTFVRSEREEDAIRAINRANERQTDGFVVSVYRARKMQVKVGGSMEEQRGVQPGSWKLKDTRTFKEVLLGVEKSRSGGETDSLQQRAKVEMEWCRYCLVGCIKPMYNVDLVKEALMSDGLKTEVCPWYEQTVVLKFTNNIDRNRCWRERGELLRLWFQELEFLEGFESKKKVKTWVNLHDVPLCAWNINFLHEVVSRWGGLIKTDDDTENHRRFDVARFLIHTRRTTIIPERIALVLNGAVYHVKVTMELFEAEQPFIDEGTPTNQHWEEGDDASLSDNQS